MDQKNIFLLLFSIIIGGCSKAMDLRERGKPLNKQLKSTDLIKPYPLPSEVLNVVKSHCLGNKQMWYEKCKFKHDLPVVEAQFNCDEMAILSATKKKLYMWDIASKTMLDRTKGNMGYISAIHFDNNKTKVFIEANYGKTVYIGSEDGVDKNERAEDITLLIPIQCLKANDEPCYIRCLACNKEGALLALGTERGVYLWDVTGQPFKQIHILEHESDINSVFFNNDGTKLVTGSYDGVVAVWDCKTHDLLLSVKPKCCTFNAFLNKAETLLFTESKSVHHSYVMVWDAKTGILIKQFKHHYTSIIDLFLTQNETQLVTILRHGDVYVWDIVRDDNVKRMNVGWPCCYARLNKDETELIILSKENVGSIWDMSTGERKAKMNCFGQVDLFMNYAVHCSQDGMQMLTMYGKTACIWQRYDDFTFAQLWLLHRLHKWYLLQKPDKAINNSALLLKHVAKDMHYGYHHLSRIWKTFPHFVRNGIWRGIATIIKTYGKN